MQFFSFSVYDLKLCKLAIFFFIFIFLKPWNFELIDDLKRPRQLKDPLREINKDPSWIYGQQPPMMVEVNFDDPRSFISRLSRESTFGEPFIVLFHALSLSLSTSYLATLLPNSRSLAIIQPRAKRRHFANSLLSYSCYRVYEKNSRGGTI